MSIPLGDGVFSSAWLSSVLAESPDWRHGALRAPRVTRIGAEYGLSGQIHRVVAETKHGGSRSFVVKQDSASAVARALCETSFEALAAGLLVRYLGRRTEARFPDGGAAIRIFARFEPA